MRLPDDLKPGDRVLVRRLRGDKPRPMYVTRFTKTQVVLKSDFHMHAYEVRLNKVTGCSAIADGIYREHFVGMADEA